MSKSRANLFRMSAIVVIVGLLFVWMWDGPSSAQVKAEFQSAHPTFAVFDVYVGEGDGGAAYFHIRYQRPSDTRIHEDVWQYLKDDKGWGLAHQSSAHDHHE